MVSKHTSNWHIYSELKSCLLLVLTILSLFLAACTSGGQDETATLASTATGEGPLPTSRPTRTPAPAATDTPEPTATARPSPTPERETLINPHDPVIPLFINHPAPESTLDFSPFESAGCPADQFGRRFCEPDSPLRALGCHLLAEPSPWLGFLEPAYPLMLCVVKPSLDADDPSQEIERFREAGSFIRAGGGLDPEFYRYVLVRDGAFEVLETTEAFREVFAPIESPDEALGYAVALMRATALYGLSYDPDLVYTISELEDTRVEAGPEGYLINLYDYQEFGCGPHPTVLVEVRVTSAGELEELARTPAYRDPAKDDLCVD